MCDSKRGRASSFRVAKTGGDGTSRFDGVLSDCLAGCNHSTASAQKIVLGGRVFEFA